MLPPHGKILDRCSIDVQKKMRERYGERRTGQSPRDTACLSDGIPTMRLWAGGISRDFSPTSHALHASTSFSASPPGLCQWLAPLGPTPPCAARQCRGHDGARRRPDVRPGRANRAGFPQPFLLARARQVRLSTPTGAPSEADHHATEAPRGPACSWPASRRLSLGLLECDDHARPPPPALWGGLPSP